MYIGVFLRSLFMYTGLFVQIYTSGVPHRGVYRFLFKVSFHVYRSICIDILVVYRHIYVHTSGVPTYLCTHACRASRATQSCSHVHICTVE